jgi:hypothetical protein
MQTSKRLFTFAAGGALAVLTTVASAQMINDPGSSRWVPPSADVTVHRSAELSQDAKEPATGSVTRPVSEDESHSKTDKQGANEPAAATRDRG